MRFAAIRAIILKLRKRHPMRDMYREIVLAGKKLESYIERPSPGGFAGWQVRSIITILKLIGILKWPVINMWSAI